MHRTADWNHLSDLKPLAPLSRRKALSAVGLLAVGSFIPSETVSSMRPVPTSDRPPQQGGGRNLEAPFPVWGVTLLSWNDRELPETVSWRPQTWKEIKPTGCGSQAVDAVRLTTSRAKSGRGVLELSVHLVGGNSLLCQGETYVDVRYHAPPCTRASYQRNDLIEGAPLDLTGAKITAYLWAPNGAQGPRHSPTGLQLFAKSVDTLQEGEHAERWWNHYGDWRNVQKGWNKLELRPGRKARYGPPPDAGFDSRRVGLLGVKIGAGPVSKIAIEETFWLDQVVIELDSRSRLDYDFEQIEGTLQALTRTRVNHVAVIPTWYMDTPKSSIIHPDNDFTTAKTYPDPELINTIEMIHRSGFAVLLKPHVDCIKDSEGNRTEVWRGDLEPESIDDWFDSYRRMILNYADIAQRTGVELLAVGTELESMQQHTDQWESVIAEVRTRYRGQLTYAANWGSLLRERSGYREVPFWDRLDLAGIDAYFPLNDSQSPSLDQLVQGWEPWVKQVEEWQGRIRRPVVFTEIGYYSVNHAARHPWERQPQPEANAELQARCYEAAIRALSGRPWFKGMFWWGWSPYTGTGGLCDTSYVPQNKPAERIL